MTDETRNSTRWVDIALGEALAAPPPSVADIVNETRQTYEGPLVVGEDLMMFDIGASGIAVYRAASEPPTLSR